MTGNTQDNVAVEDDEDENRKLGDVIGDSWAARVYVFIGALLGLGCAVIFLIFITPRHTATMMIAPAERAGGTNIRALFPENSSFTAKYLESSIGSEKSTNFVRFEHILLGPSVAKRLIADPSLVIGVKQSKQMLFFSGPTVRTPQELSNYLKNNVSIEPVGTSQMIRLVYLHPDAQFAVNLLKSIYETTDHIIKKDIKTQAIKRATYFRKSLETETNPEHREALSSLLIGQEHILDMLAVDEPFAATIAEPASTGIAPDWPPYPLVIGVFMFAGMFWSYGRFYQRYKGRPKSKRKRNFDD